MTRTTLLLPLLLLGAAPAHAEPSASWPAGHIFQGERGGKRLRKAPRRDATIRQVATRSSGHYFFSPTGSHLVALVRDKGFVMMRPDGSEARTIHSHRGRGFFRFTPDGERVVTVGGAQTIVTALDGSESREVGSGSVSMSVTPDSKWIATSGIGGPIFLRSLVGEKARRLKSPNASSPQFSDDMRRVLYHSGQRYLLEDLTSGVTTDVTARFQGGHDARLTPSGLVYWGKTGLHLGPPDGGDPIERITPEGWRYHFPPKLVADKRAVASQGEGGSALFVADLPARTFSRVSPKAMRGEKVWPFVESTPGRLFYALYTEAPKGEKTKVPGRSFEARVASLDDGTDRPLFRAYGVYTLIMKPTPDGKRLVIAIHTSSNKMTFFDLHLATGRITRVTPDYPGWSNFYVSADSRHFVFGVQTKANQPREYTLYTVELRALP